MYSYLATPNEARIVHKLDIISCPPDVVASQPDDTPLAKSHTRGIEAGDSTQPS